ncbi:MAG TPA: hypothetical protein VEC01_11425 [Noviherbaspirillum sp.]|uniref:hypothetical protein n=1 Tax=Noviherbaspirillum sp. TaxID=1926288 RepID=UPI002D6C4DA1|nr:hypothetical protein [Noviherbaspirillum sp.]HYD95928.1 hypothetical protein [Noviherbaspirillum sp.]
MKSVIHAVAGSLALLLVAAFFTATLVSELFLDLPAVAQVKQMIVYGIALLVPCMAVAGGSGFSLANGRKGNLTEQKKRRMRIIGMNGLLLLAPAAVFLHLKASSAEFDALFYAVQAVELVAGLAQLIMLGLNFRDGLRLAGRTRRVLAAS